MPSGSKYERELKRILEGNGWLVIRSAGSLGTGDLVALRPDNHMIIEVKACKGDRFYTSNTQRNKDQFISLNNLADRRFNVYYAIRWKGKKEWDMFRLPMESYPIFRKGEGKSLEEL